jgi:endonuclease YncB( thermonuclease family)
VKGEQLVSRIVGAVAAFIVWMASAASVCPQEKLPTRAAPGFVYDDSKLLGLVPMVVDGDTIKLDGITYRIWSIDAAETKQACADRWMADKEATAPSSTW